MISENIIHEVKGASLVDIASKYTTLKRRGSEWAGLCPFHNERTPSFYVSAKGFKCFGCGIGGANAIDFIMKLENQSYADAVVMVASLAGIYINDTNNNKLAPPQTKRKQPLPSNVDIIPPEAIQANLEAYKANHLFTFMAAIYGEVITSKQFTRYGVGSCKKLGEGTTLFAQKDIQGNYRQIKAILYDPQTGKRIKNIDPLIIGRSELAKHIGQDYGSINLLQCYFGECLLSGNSKPVALVESCKTAMIASLFYPQFIWIATGGKSGASWYSKEVCRVLAGRHIYLFPDVDGKEDWQSHVKELKAHTGSEVTLIDIMDGQPAPRGKQKYDIADLLIDSGKQLASEVINSNDIFSMMGETHTQKEFGSLIIAGIKTRQGKVFDIF